MKTENTNVKVATTTTYLRSQLRTKGRCNTLLDAFAWRHLILQSEIEAPTEVLSLKEFQSNV